jgi:hypothetical protein
MSVKGNGSISFSIFYKVYFARFSRNSLQDAHTLLYFLETMKGKKKLLTRCTNERGQKKKDRDHIIIYAELSS